ncbi:MAG: hypothetical protein GQ564_18600 [Bacteroidales bacterium]|nr:hypothetical protein [Bacteroidales bacterium]
MHNLCSKTQKCPLFNDNLLKRKESAETYKNIFCRDNTKYKECKRFIISEKVGKCANFVMPNSMLSIEQITERMRNERLI